LLAIGHNAQLFYARSAPLQQAGFEIFIAEEPSEAHRFYSNLVFDVIVLGASIERSERLGLAHHFKLLHPKSTIVMLASAYEIDLYLHPCGTADKCLESVGDMDDIVAALLQALRPDPELRAETCSCSQEA
jgi:DNA-binding NtrC family response regulator